jgi:hypothetical protein
MKIYAYFLFGKEVPSSLSRAGSDGPVSLGIFFSFMHRHSPRFSFYIVLIMNCITEIKNPTIAWG